MTLAPVGAMFMVICMMINVTLGNICGPAIMCATGSSGLAWFISGIVWRFRSDGAFSCGDIDFDSKRSDEEWQSIVTAEDSLYQHSSGKFMLIYYCIVWGFISIHILVSLILGAYYCLFIKSDDDSS